MSLWVAPDDNQVAEQRTWLKLVARLNITYMVVTAETFHAERSWLKAVAKANMAYILVTAETSHDERSWLKAGAL